MSNPNNYEECDECGHVGPDVGFDGPYTTICEDCENDFDDTTAYDSDYNDRMTERRQMGISNF